MTATYAVTSRTQRGLAFALIVALHGIGIACWPKRHAEHADPLGGVLVMSLIAAAPVKRAPDVVPVGRAGPARPARRPAPPVRAPVAALTMIAPEPAEAKLAPQADQRSASEMLDQAKREVGKIDRELRKSSLNMGERNLTLSAPRRESLIAGAFIDRAPPKIVEEVMSDGRHRSRIGNMCAYMEPNGGVVGGRDVFKSSTKVRYETCPH